jgi:hypothetical protein
MLFYNYKCIMAHGKYFEKAIRALQKGLDESV